MSEKTTFTEQGKAASQAQLQAFAQASLDQKMARMKAFVQNNPNHEFSKVNQHLLKLDTQQSWNGAGLLSMSGFGWWALNLSVDVAYPHYVIYNATGGPDWTVSLFTSSVAGYFLVDPSTLRGACNFSMQSVGVGVGEISIDLFYQNGTQVGSFFGAAVGVSISKVSGSGTIEYH